MTSRMLFGMSLLCTISACKACQARCHELDVSRLKQCAPSQSSWSLLRSLADLPAYF